MAWHRAKDGHYYYRGVSRGTGKYYTNRTGYKYSETSSTPWRYRSFGEKLPAFLILSIIFPPFIIVVIILAIKSCVESTELKARHRRQQKEILAALARHNAQHGERLTSTKK